MRIREHGFHFFNSLLGIVSHFAAKTIPTILVSFVSRKSDRKNLPSKRTPNPEPFPAHGAASLAHAQTPRTHCPTPSCCVAMNRKGAGGQGCGRGRGCSGKRGHVLYASSSPKALCQREKHKTKSNQLLGNAGEFRETKGGGSSRLHWSLSKLNWTQSNYPLHAPFGCLCWFPAIMRGFPQRRAGNPGKEVSAAGQKEEQHLGILKRVKGVQIFICGQLKIYLIINSRRGSPIHTGAGSSAVSHVLLAKFSILLFALAPCQKVCYNISGK